MKELIRRHLTDSALYGGAIASRGPRYCPSIEDKIVKFPDALRHQVFLEPEGLDTDELYVGGLSTSLPPEVQQRMLRLVPGLERVEMTRPGYAIEYDYLPPTQLDRSLAVKGLPGLFAAGQINGTTGYEEAAGQGALAGLNAAAHAQGKPPVIMGRDEGYCGVLVDDLVSCGVDEPYRLFTSRAEHRLMLRQDNALRRMAPVAIRLGLWSPAERAQALARLEREEEVRDVAIATAIHPGQARRALADAGTNGISEPVRIAELVKRPGVSLVDLLRAVATDFDDEDAEWAGIELRYGGYLARERMAAAKLARLEETPLPTDLPWNSMESLSREAREKLNRVRPTTLAQAGRIPGVSPSDLQHLLVEVLRRERVS